MDLDSLLIGAILMAICIVPIIILSQSRNKSESQKLKSLIVFANQYNSQINLHEAIGDFIIGLDTTKNLLFFQKKTNEIVQEKSINLAEIQKCKVHKAGRTVKNSEGNFTLIDRLDLNFLPLGKNKIEITLPFYNNDDNPQIYGELEAVEK